MNFTPTQQCVRYTCTVERFRSVCVFCPRSVNFIIIYLNRWWTLNSTSKLLQHAKGGKKSIKKPNTFDRNVVLHTRSLRARLLLCWASTSLHYLHPWLGCLFWINKYFMLESCCTLSALTLPWLLINIVRNGGMTISPSLVIWFIMFLLTTLSFSIFLLPGFAVCELSLSHLAFFPAPLS